MATHPGRNQLDKKFSDLLTVASENLKVESKILNLILTIEYQGKLFNAFDLLVDFIFNKTEFSREQDRHRQNCKAACLFKRSIREKPIDQVKLEVKTFFFQLVKIELEHLKNKTRDFRGVLSLASESQSIEAYHSLESYCKTYEDHPTVASQQETCVWRSFY